MDPWYKIVTARKEVSEGRSFNPDEFAIHLEQVVTGRAPKDYRDPEKFFSRTVFTSALTEHVGMVLRRLSGETANTAPVLTMVTQFGGGKTHTLTALYHLAEAGRRGSAFVGVGELLEAAGLTAVPEARTAVFVGNAWDPQPGRETPWIDVARQIAGDKGVELLGSRSSEIPPGTEALGRIFEAAERPVLVLFDEVLNFVNRHRDLADPFHAFLQNLTVAMTATTRGAAIISLPRSQVEMTDWDVAWQERITKIVKRVARDLIANDEAEIGEVVRRRLFEDFGAEEVRGKVAAAYARWAFERRSQLPPEWMAVDTATSDTKAKQLLRTRFEAAYPFHPATLTVFQRKWQALPQYQQTRGTLAMLAQWVSYALVEAVRKGSKDPLITLGSAPLHHKPFREVVLGQLGEQRLQTALDVDVAGDNAHARALDADTKGPLRGIHRQVGAVIFFESSGGVKDKVAHEPELRFAVGGPDVETTSVDSAARALEQRAYYIRRVGTDGYQTRHQPTLKKVVADRRAALDEEGEVVPAMEEAVQRAFGEGCRFFPKDSTEVPDDPRLLVVVLEPRSEWTGDGSLREQLASWTQARGKGARLYPGSLVWCARSPGQELRRAVEDELAWKRVQLEAQQGTLSGFAPEDQAEIRARLVDARDRVEDQVWADYRFVVLYAPNEEDRLEVMDLAPGHASAGGSLRDRILAGLRSQGRLNESVGASYIVRHWPEAFRETGAWPLSSLRQAFLNGSLDRLLDPTAALRARVPEFVETGDFGLAAGQRPDGSFERTWFPDEPLDPAEVRFDGEVFLLTKEAAGRLQGEKPVPSPPGEEIPPGGEPVPEPTPAPPPLPPPAGKTTLRVHGPVSPDAWNRLGMKLVPKLKTAEDVQLSIDFQATLSSRDAEQRLREIRQVLEDLGMDRTLLLEEHKVDDHEN